MPTSRRSSHPRLPLTDAERRAALAVLRRPLWTAPMERAIAEAALATNAATDRQRPAILATTARVERAKAESRARP